MTPYERNQKILERIPAAAVCGFRQHDGIDERLADAEQRVARLEAALADDAIMDEDGQCTACWMWVADGSPHDSSCLILYLRAALAGEQEAR